MQSGVIAVIRNFGKADMYTKVLPISRKGTRPCISLSWLMIPRTVPIAIFLPGIDILERTLTYPAAYRSTQLHVLMCTTTFHVFTCVTTGLGQTGRSAIQLSLSPLRRRPLSRELKINPEDLFVLFRPRIATKLSFPLRPPHRCFV